MTRESLLEEALEAVLGTHPGTLLLKPLLTTGGGCINQVARVESGGLQLFVKWNDRPLAGQFEAEALGLKALRAAGTSLVIPEPICWSDAGAGQSFLVLEYLETGPPAPDFDEQLGRGLAALHGATSNCGFGFGRDGYCGATLQQNAWHSDWVEFYRERRLGYQLRLARENGLTPLDCARLERLLEKLPLLLESDEEPALIHGDLWSGNLHVTQAGRPSLIDPAAYFAHREAEFGMLALFGGFGPRVYSAYEELTPLANGFRERLELYSLYHLLNHFNLFGGAYGSQAMQIVRHHVD